MYVYLHTPNDLDSQWKKVGNNQARWISASPDSLWILESETEFPYKFDEKTQQFTSKGTVKGE